MIPEGDEALGELVNVVLHESVHATVYVNGQSYFNESLASFIADRLTSEYLQSSKGINSAETQAYEDSVRLSEKNTKILAAAYQQLSQIYDSDRTREQKQAEKNRIYLKLKDELKFKRDLNNATLIQYKTYNMGEADFETLLRACDHNWKRFLEVTKHLKLDSFSHSQQESLHGVLDSAIHSHCN
jgi:predicted aminopeptidase